MPISINDKVPFVLSPYRILSLPYIPILAPFKPTTYLNVPSKYMTYKKGTKTVSTETTTWKTIYGS